MTVIPRLFGTSGIRGVFENGCRSDPVCDFITGNRLTPELALLLALAVSELHRADQCRQPVEIWRDVRESGIALAGALMQGFRRNGIEYIYRGIAPTTLYTFRSDRWVIVVTASHNPVTFNGLKVFREGRPLERRIEIEIESVMTRMAKQGNFRLDPVQVLPEDTMELETYRMQLHHLRAEASIDSIRTSIKTQSGHFFLPLDLAYGAAACPVDRYGRITRLSPQLAALLSLGFPVVGYGCTRDPVRTNHRIGAAYAYGETPDLPDPGEMAAFASGESGYGGGAERIIFWPERSRPAGLCENLPDGAVEILAEQDDEYPGAIAVITIDSGILENAAKNRIMDVLRARQPLPGFMVDCDADRILITTPRLAAMPVPYLSGDGMIRFFAETAEPGTWNEIAFTVESGIALDIALNQLARDYERNGPERLSIRKVTVGDRAIIDCFMDAGPGRRMGGEPSGHMIFHHRDADRHHLIDDPFVTYLMLLRQLLESRRTLDDVMAQLFRSVPEVYCARKPDARARTGLTAAEKSALELWENGVWNRLSAYAAEFIPFYTALFAEAAGDLFGWGSPKRIAPAMEWNRLKRGVQSLPEEGWRMPLAEIEYADDLRITAFLYLDKREWAGPEVIRMEFFFDAEAEDERVLIGEGVFRNSGTGPKNAGYHKFWILHPVTGANLDHHEIFRVLNRLAALRADFTDHYVESVLRK